VATTAEDRLNFRHNPHASSRQVSDDRSNTNACLEKFVAAEVLEVGFSTQRSHGKIVSVFEDR